MSERAMDPGNYIQADVFEGDDKIGRYHFAVPPVVGMRMMIGSARYHVVDVGLTQTASPYAGYSSYMEPVVFVAAARYEYTETR